MPSEINCSWKITLPLVQNVVVTDDTLTVELADARTVSAPLAWYPRLMHGSAEIIKYPERFLLKAK